MGLREKMKGPGARVAGAPPAPARREPLVDEKHVPPQQPPAEALAEPPPSAPQAAAPITMILDSDAVLASAPQPPPKPLPAPPGPADLSPSGVAAMAPDRLVAVAVSEMHSRRISDEDGLMDAKELRPLYRAVRDSGLLEQVLIKVGEAAQRAEAATRVEAAAPKAKPPPPPLRPRPSRPPPVSVRAGKDRVTGEEPTIAAPELAQASVLPPTAPAAISSFLDSLDNDVKLNTEQRLGKAKSFYEAQLNALLAQCGGDEDALRKMILAQQASAGEKKERRAPLSQMEQYIVDLTRLSSRVADLTKKLRGEQEFQQLAAKRKSNMPGVLPKIPSPDRRPAESLNPPADAAEAASPAHDERPAPEQKAKVPSPERPSKRPSATALEPQKEQANGGRKSEPPPQRKGRGAFARFMLSPVTWTTVCVGGFTAAMFATHGFDDAATFFNLNMARIPAAAPYIRRVWEGWMHLSPLESAAGSMQLYFGLTGLGVLGGIYRKYRRVRKKEHELEELGIGEETFQRMRNYVVPILHRIFDEYGEGTYPEKLRAKLVEDAKFFMYMEEIYRTPAKFSFIMKEADVPPKQVAKFHMVFSDAENRIIKIRLEDYVKYVDDPGLRLTTLREMYERDQLFKKKLDEVFFRNLGGDYVHQRKQTDVAKALGSGDTERGVAIFKKLELDYFKITEKERK